MGFNIQTSKVRQISEYRKKFPVFYFQLSFFKSSIAYLFPVNLFINKRMVRNVLL